MTTPKSIPMLRSKIQPPGASPRLIQRARLTASLSQALEYRLTLIQAHAGYGKSTALAALAGSHQPVIWLQCSDEERDPLALLTHLYYASQNALPGLPNQLPTEWALSEAPIASALWLDQWLVLLEQHLRQPALLILDDAQAILDTHETALLIDRLVGRAPDHLHIILSSRQPVSLPNLFRWRSRGEVLSFDQSLLAFTEDEVIELFGNSYAQELSHNEARQLLTATEGWAIALQMLGQSLRSGSLNLAEALNRPLRPQDGLFDWLAAEVLDQQPTDLQHFLKVTSLLRYLTASACDALLQSTDSNLTLAHLRRQDLFIVEVDEDRWRYHPIFRGFLMRSLEQSSTPAERQAWHRRLASFFRATPELDQAFYHDQQAGDTLEAARLLEDYGVKLLTAGRLDTLAAYLDQLPLEALQQFPGLLFHLGDLARLRSRFTEALGWYQQAERLCRQRGLTGEISRALRGQARVYLDTVNPARAEELLQEALRLSDGVVDRDSRSRLLELMAENKLNAGKPDEAERLRQQAEDLRAEGPSDSQLLYRVLLRTGRLQDARRRLEERAAAERQQPVPTPRAHRETLFLLSLIYSFIGEEQLALSTAKEGTRRAAEFSSPFVTAVGHMRQGHALLLHNTPESNQQARQMFERAVDTSRSLDVPRLRVEALWGLCRAYGYVGELSQALIFAQEGLELGTQAGDEWISSLVRLALGASLALHERYETALHWLAQAGRGFQECSDAYGGAAVRLWNCLIWYKQGRMDALNLALPGLLETCQANHFDDLLLRSTVLGPPDSRRIVPLLILARQRGWQADYALALLRQLGLEHLPGHPGYRLHIHTLGTFQVWRGTQPIPANAWRRDKTRQLLQILITFRSSPLDREQILEHLWPGADPAAAQRNFKVTLNALLNALEPERAPGAESTYVLRQGTIYSLRPQADLELDCESFQAALQKGDDLATSDPLLAVQSWEQALAIYQGEYLPEARYETWSAAERERLTALFLEGADRLCRAYLDQQHTQPVIELCLRILAIDNCWERAYRYLMQAYAHLGDRGQLARIYQRCVSTLQDELDVSPSEETRQLYLRLVHSPPAEANVTGK